MAREKVVHREGSRREKAHMFIKEHPRMERSEVVKMLTRKLKVKPTTASTWFQTFKRH